jgi:hypothetical protein
MSSASEPSAAPSLTVQQCATSIVNTNVFFYGFGSAPPAGFGNHDGQQTNAGRNEQHNNPNNYNQPGQQHLLHGQGSQGFQSPQLPPGLPLLLQQQQQQQQQILEPNVHYLARELIELLMKKKRSGELLSKAELNTVIGQILFLDADALPRVVCSLIEYAARLIGVELPSTSTQIIKRIKNVKNALTGREMGIAGLDARPQHQSRINMDSVGRYYSQFAHQPAPNPSQQGGGLLLLQNDVDDVEVENESENNNVGVEEQPLHFDMLPLAQTMDEMENPIENIDTKESVNADEPSVAFANGDQHDEKITDSSPLVAPRPILGGSEAMAQQEQKQQEGQEDEEDDCHEKGQEEGQKGRILIGANVNEQTHQPPSMLAQCGNAALVVASLSFYPVRKSANWTYRSLFGGNNTQRLQPTTQRVQAVKTSDERSVTENEDGGV